MLKVATSMVPRLALLLGCLALSACAGASARRFPLRDPMWHDTDTRPVWVACRAEPTDEDPKNVACAPEPYESSFAWDAADNTLFRPLARVFAVEPGGEAVNVNSLDEVPDSAWFTNRIGRRAVPREALLLGACAPSQRLDPGATERGGWLIDEGKPNGASPGFRIRTAGKAKYMLKTDSKQQPERPSAASVIGAAIYHAVGFNTSCEQIVYFEPSILTLKPGLTYEANVGGVKSFDQAALQRVLDEAVKRGGLVRMQASSWLPGALLGPFKYEGTRDDDPNDVIPHEDRRELRGGRLLAAWLNHFDAREQNSMDTWIAADPGRPGFSPGHVRHFYLDTSDCFGSEWAWDGISRRLGHSYLLDFEDIAVDFVTFGVLPRPWDQVERTKGAEIFGYYDVEHFDPEGWKNEYPNPAFSRMTERDGAWMARILSRFSEDDVRALVGMGKFSSPRHAAFLAATLEGRLRKILERYLLRLSPVADLAVHGGDALCGVDLARRRRVRTPEAFRYEAELWPEGPARPRALRVEASAGGGVCVRLPHIAADGGSPDDAPGRYAVVKVRNGAARGTLEAHLYDLGPKRGYRLVGLERPEP
ncbi:hypothetical protein [Sorangium sp. So ce1389]|uniref:hypothetical protein n=1 Tax=Sorangium sp. So ce1389 TaxID=3133336 RepID=UPI003F61500C